LIVGPGSPPDAAYRFIGQLSNPKALGKANQLSFLPDALRPGGSQESDLVAVCGIEQFAFPLE
jgi:hypothetical protein